MSRKITVGIVGGTGYTAGELLRILIHHPNAEIEFVYSTSQAGESIDSVHTDLRGNINLCFSNSITETDVIFLCLGHGISRSFLSENKISTNTKIIDLSNDFRLESEFDGRQYVYGLPELLRDEIKGAENIANPGCFATAIELALLPLTADKLVSGDIHISGITGSTGAGRSLSATTHFSYRNNNISTYQVFTHRHLKEVKQILGCNSDIYFVPHRGDFARGIHITLYTESNLSEKEAVKLFSDYYAEHPYTIVSKDEISMKDAVNSNKCLLNVRKIGDKLFITSVIDNLIKGASGQAIQNMNLMFGLDETRGLGLKSQGY